MHIKINQSVLSSAAIKIISCAGKKSTLPILANFKLEADKNYLKILTSDLEITAVAKINCVSLKSGTTTVNAKLFCDLIRELPDGEINISLEDGERLEITSERSKYKLSVVPAEGFPDIKGTDIKTNGRIRAGDLVEMINKTIYAVSFDQTQLNIGGIGCDYNENNLIFIGTDKNRLSLISKKADGLKIDRENLPILPRRVASEIKRIVEAVNPDDILGVDIIDGMFIVEGDNFKISAALINASFIGYSKLLSAEVGKICSVLSGEISSAIKRASLMATGDDIKVVELEFTKDIINIKGASLESGEGFEQVSCKYDGESFRAGFNARYLLDFINPINSDSIVLFELSGEKRPLKIYPADQKEYLGFIMPMRND
ncbi:MAG TPA: DNA polymerase III subunit beta [Oligoflexia bacterium]|nr:DNA polymerase III subunit beta [Oligoflexia bacterium]HMP26900.1 DNA polymerase III subunit beta [Oligoflexia bacterium]